MLGDATRHDAMRSVIAKRMLEARAGGGFLKTAAGYERERTGGGTAPVPEPGTETGTGGADDFGSEQEEKVERLCGDGMG